jgi:hypothetical protein
MLRSGLRIYLRIERETFLAGLRPAAWRPAPSAEGARMPAPLSRP